MLDLFFHTRSNQSNCHVEKTSPGKPSIGPSDAAHAPSARIIHRKLICACPWVPRCVKYETNTPNRWIFTNLHYSRNPFAPRHRYVSPSTTQWHFQNDSTWLYRKREKRPQQSIRPRISIKSIYFYGIY